jgi:lipopolysaccharide transport system permease protein
MPNSIKHLWRHRSLILTLSRRELNGRFQGTLLGRLWLVLAPLLMLCIYAFFFGEILQAKWSIGASGSGFANFTLILFSGLMLHQFLSECLSRAPDLVLSNPNYVKKIIFPLEILALVTVKVTSLQLLISVLVLLGAFVVMTGQVYWQWIFLPLILIPFVVLTVGLVWLFSALGVFLRDLGQMVLYLSNILLFMSPVFYPMDRLPDGMQFIYYVNPLIVIIEQVRQVLFMGASPDWVILLGYSAIALVVACVGYYFFSRSKPAFADVM